MRKLILLFATFLMFGCSIYYENGQSDMRLTYKDIELDYKNGFYYRYGKPFTGIVYTEHDNGRMKMEMKFKEGKKDGNWEWYRSDGHILKKEIWKEGELVKTVEWN